MNIFFIREALKALSVYLSKENEKKEGKLKVKRWILNTWLIRNTPGNDKINKINNKKNEYRKNKIGKKIGNIILSVLCSTSTSASTL